MLCVEVAGKSNSDMHFNLQSFMKTLPTLDLEHWEVILSNEREILDKVMKVVELQNKRRYVHELYDNITETEQN